MVKSSKSENASEIEWPTVGLILANYMAWFGCLILFDMAPVVSVAGMCVVLALQSSLSHELIHGHPTGSNAVNMALGIIPLTLIFPIHLFKETHLKHHDDDNLTIPGVDPESFFHCPLKWLNKSRVGRMYAWINMTLLGRLLFSVPDTLVQVIRYAIRDARYGNRDQRGQWVLHFTLIVLVCTIVDNLDWMPLHVYFLCAWAGHSAIALRAFFEHRPALQPGHRIVIVKSNWFFRLLYLSNNYHAVHHQFPHLPWYRIARLYNDTRTEVLTANDGFYFSGYFEWLVYLFQPIHSPVYPRKITPET